MGQSLSQAVCLRVNIYMALRLPWEKQPRSPLVGNLSALTQGEQTTSRVIPMFLLLGTCMMKIRNHFSRNYSLLNSLFLVCSISWCWCLLNCSCF